VNLLTRFRKGDDVEAEIKEAGRRPISLAAKSVHGIWIQSPIIGCQPLEKASESLAATILER
jgi:hypothetical protein